jgi:hypothetical protein
MMKQVVNYKVTAIELQILLLSFQQLNVTISESVMASVYSPSEMQV